ncbi:putative uncharacterized protein DDB_G0282499 isoform X2 [Phymastichus coffea]|uniref:putative uncharacterized protein DDB_G0282499 isoform X2 n=1 Tax=Phymastichus coffea TaxID=108790 RepID=UPI00273A95B6|nr:putative uncharacterized protein DDB_G0282499 isoform X2 [Phymastichus coffea]
MRTPSDHAILNDEIARGKRQENGASYIDSIFNIPIQAIKSTSTAAQNWSPQNAGTIDSVLKIPITTLEAVSQLIKNRQQNKHQETTPLSAASRPTRQPQRRYDNPTTISSEDSHRLGEEAKRLVEVERERQREVIRRRVDAQREQQRLYIEQLHRRRFAQLQNYNDQMQQQITSADQRAHHKFYRNPFGFNALTKWIIGNNPQHTFNGHAGNGDGHVYQYYNEQRPLHFGHHQELNRPVPTKPTPPSLSSTTVGTTTISTSTLSSPTSTSTTSTTGAPSHSYQVFEIVDEGANPFTWPNWLGVINTLANNSPQTFLKKQKNAFDEPLQNKIAPKYNDYYKIKYVEAKKKALEAEITGNEIDGDVASGEARIVPAEGKVLFPSK